MAATAAECSGGSAGHTSPVSPESQSRWSDAVRRFSNTVRSSNSSSDWNDLDTPARARRYADRRRMTRVTEDDVSRMDARETGDRVDRGGLARTVRTDQADDLARMDLERQAVDGHHAAVPDLQAVDA